MRPILSDLGRIGASREKSVDLIAISLWELLLFHFTLFLEREVKGGITRGRKHRVSCLSHVLQPGIELQPRHVPLQDPNWPPFALGDDAQPTEPLLVMSKFFSPVK